MYSPSTLASIIVRKHKLRIALRVRHAQQHHKDNNHTTRRPVNANLINKIQIPCAKNIREHANHHNSPEHQHRLPLIRHKVLIPQRNRRQDELPARKVDRQRNSPIPHERQPSSNPGRNRRPLARTQHRRPIIHTARGRIHGADFRERRSDAQRNQRDKDPAVEHGDGLAVGERDVQRG